MKDEEFLMLKRKLDGVRQNVPLKRHTTFKIGGPARYFLATAEKEEVSRALKLARKLEIPVFILGGGSNVLAADQGFSGLVIKIQDGGGGVKVRKRGPEFLLTAGAGVPLKRLVAFAASRGLTGLEWAGGLPGTFGGAIRGNAGAFGGETKDAIVEVAALDDTFSPRKFSREACQFSYRSSVFKKKGWVVLSATVALTQGDKKEIARVVRANITYRKTRHPLERPNAGSIFKNCEYGQFSEPLRATLASVVKQDPFPVIPTAYLLAESGVKGKTIGQAQVSPKHPNFIVNLGSAKASDVLEIIEYNKQQIREKYGIELEQEVQFLH